MNTIIMTIKPVHLGNIRRGRKTYELRKTKPLCKTPFKVLCCESGSGGQIKAEFVCNSIGGIHNFDLEEPDVKAVLDSCCVTMNEARDYLGEKDAYLFHISDMIDYCSTKGYRVRNISELGLKRPPRSWQYVREVVET